MNDFVDKKTKPNVRRGGQSSRMSQLLRASLANVSDRPPPCDVVLNHFSHRHPLLRLHLRESEGIKCSFCNIIISGWAYACEKHCDYYFHEVCCNFPRKIHHDFHPVYDHTLILRPFQLSNNNEQFHCRACGFDDSELSLFQSYYCCDSCNFNLHVECASIPITLNHKKKYPLHLFLSFPITSEAAALFCSICAKEVPTSGCWVFYNHDHDYLCHFECAAVTEYATNNDSMSELQTRLQTLVLTNSPPTPPDLSCGDVTHYHALREFVSSWPLRFNLCEFTVFSGYICSDCNYFIDKNCFSIPSKIQHMSHPQHPLKFTRYTDFMHEDLKCTGCDADFKHLGNGRAYYCTQCKFIINRYCASAPKSLTLEDNVSYELFFSFPFKHGNAEIDCNICSDVVVIKDGLFYYNRECHEALHVICALDEEAGFDNDKMDMLSIQRLQELRII